MIELKHSLPAFIDKIYTTVPDCIGEPKDYFAIIPEILSLTDGLLVLSDLRCEKAETSWTMSFSTSKQIEEINITPGSYFDAKIITQLNDLIHSLHPTEPRRLITLEGGSYDFAICFTTKENEWELAKAKHIYRSETWFDEQKEIQELHSKTSIPIPSDALEVWYGLYKQDNSEEVFKFKFIITERQDNLIKGRIHEGMDLGKEEDMFITFVGKVENGKISFLKTYGEGHYKKVMKTLESSGIPIDSFVAPTLPNEVNYQGEIVDNKADGIWHKKAIDGSFMRMDLESSDTSGIWNMKKIA